LPAGGFLAVAVHAAGGGVHLGRSRGQRLQRLRYLDVEGRDVASMARLTLFLAQLLLALLGFEPPRRHGMS